MKRHLSQHPDFPEVNMEPCESRVVTLSILCPVPLTPFFLPVWGGTLIETPLAIGVLILLYQVALIDFSRADLVTYGCVFLGIMFLVKGVNNPQRHRIFGGVFFSVFGLSMLLMRERIFPRADRA